MMRMEDGWRSIETATLDTGRQPFYCNRRELRNIMKKEGSSLFDMGRRKEQMFFMFVQSFTNGQIMGFGC